MNPEVHHVIVVGTGPTGAAVVAALLRRGLRPLVLESSPESTQLRLSLEPAPSSSTGFKTWNGSDAMYRPHPQSTLTYEEGLSVRASNYLGGLSRVWGATYDQYREFRRWPRECIPAQEDWDAVAALMPRSVTGEVSSERRTLPMEPRLIPLMGLGQGRSGYQMSASSLAVEARLRRTNVCQVEGACLTGCSHDSIWWAGQQFEKWEASGQVRRLRGILVQSLVEQEKHVSLRVCNERGDEDVLHARQTFLAAGVLATAAILISSGVTSQVTVRDSQTAFGGMIALRGRLPRKVRTHSLSHIWVRSVAEANFLAQIYPPDDSHAKRLTSKFPAAPSGLLHRLNERLFPFIAYLDSDRSGTLLVSQQGNGVRVAVGNTGEHSLMHRHVSRMARHVLRAGFVLPPRPLDMALPGGGFHIGASLPHGSLTDSWGRPTELRRTYVADSSVIPHIEVGSITPTVMANAHRIARTAPLTVVP